MEVAALRQSDILATSEGVVQNRTDEELFIADKLLCGPVVMEEYTHINIVSSKHEKSITGKPKQHLIPHLIHCQNVAPDVRRRAEAQKAAWANTDIRKAVASATLLQSNRDAVLGPSTASHPGLPRLFTPSPLSESPYYCQLRWLRTSFQPNGSCANKMS